MPVEINAPCRLTTRVSLSHNRGSVTPTVSITTFRGTRVLRRDSKEKCVEDIRHLPVYRNILPGRLNKSRRETGLYDRSTNAMLANGLATDAVSIRAFHIQSSADSFARGNNWFPRRRALTLARASDCAKLLLRQSTHPSGCIQTG